MVLGKALISLCCVFQDGPISISNQFFYLMPVFFFPVVLGRGISEFGLGSAVHSSELLVEWGHGGVEGMIQ